VGSREFEVGTTLSVAPEGVIDFLMDLNRHVGLHPFLSAVSVVDSGRSPEGAWWDWSVEERLELGPFRYRLRFPTRTTRTSASSMTVMVRAAPGCRLRSTTRAEADGGGCRLVEKTVVTAPWPVLGYMAREGEAAHRRTYSLLPGAIG
jgi:hypothetical protein